MPRCVGNPDSFTVAYSRTEVLAFRDRWPCGGLLDCEIWFDFQGGDLVDVSIDYDGPDILALSQEASAFAAGHFERPDLLRG